MNMAARDRLEDIGILCEKLHNLCDHEIFEWMGNNRPKEATEWFSNLSDDAKDDVIHSMAYNLEFVQNQLYDMYQLARWGDEED